MPHPKSRRAVRADPTRRRIAELQAQRHKARERGDQEEVDRLGREIEAEREAGNSREPKYWESKRRY